MPWKDASKAEVLDAVMRFYRTALPLDEELVYPVVQPLTPPRIPHSGDFFVTVSPGDGRFPLDEQNVGVQLREDAQFTVTGYSRILLDKATADESFLLHPTRGALAIQHRLLAIVGQQLTDEAGDGIIASRVYATSSHRPTYDLQEAIGWVGISFVAEFDWKV